MGHAHSSNFSNFQQQLSLNNWIQAIEDPSAIFSKVNPYRKRLLIHKIHSELVEQYQLQFMSQQDFKMFTSEIELRKQTQNKIEMRSLEQAGMFKTSPYIYRIKYFVNTSIQELCSTTYHGLLYIGKVELRLKQINDIPFQDVLYLYKSCFEGFKVLYEHYGSFTITQEMIFFDKKGKVKLWINPNLSKNYPNFFKNQQQHQNTITIQVNDTQHDMIRQIIGLIDQNTDKIANQHQTHFEQYSEKKISTNTQLTFQKVIELFYRYIEDNHYRLGNYMRSIYDLYHEENDHFEMDFSTSNKLEVSKLQSKAMAMDMEVDKVGNGVERLMFNKSNRTYVDSKPLQLPKNTLKNHLIESGASKRSYNSQFNMRIPDNHLKSNQIIPKRQENNLYLSQKRSQITHHQKIKQQPQHYPPLPPPPPHQIMHSQQINRNILTFCPPEARVVHQPSFHPQIAKYKSLQKYPQLLINSNESKSITFSYQPKNLIPKSNVPNYTVNNTPIKQSYQVKAPKKQSFIQRLNFNQANTVRITNPYYPFQQNNLNKKVDELKETKKINYFSTSQSYILDKQIAQDMQKYLGINPNLI